MTETTAASGAARPGLRAAVALLVVLIGTIAAPLDSAVNIAFPSITRAFDRQVQDIIWVVISYVLTYASLLLVFGKLGDLIGHRIVFQAGLVISTVGFAACALATAFELLLLGRIVQGIGIALVLSCAPALATSLYGEQHRTRVLGTYAAMTALGGALGPLAGGILVEWLGWSVVFWARIPLVVVALCFSWLIPAKPGQGTSAGLDPIGSLQLVVALCAILLGLSVRDTLLGLWLRPAMVVGGCIVLAAFFRRQSQRPTPIIRPALFRDPLFSLMNAASVIANFAAFSVILIGPFYLVRVAKLDTSLAGLVLATGATGTIIGSFLAPAIVRRFGSTRTANIGMALSAAGLLGIATWDAATLPAIMALPLVLQGLGLGLFQVAYADLVTGTLPVAERGVAGSLTMVTRTIGIVGGAAGHAAVHRHFEVAAAASNATGADAFMAGFQAVFVAAALSQLAALVVWALVAVLVRHASARAKPHQGDRLP